MTLAAPVSAHRLDEYLQASRVAIAADGVSVEIDLTPGASLADRVLDWIDANRDGTVTRDEGDGYAQAVLRDMSLTVDGATAPLAFAGAEYPTVAAMREGTGAIRIRAQAAASGSGSHRLSLVNAHRSDVSVYLANVLVTSDPRVSVGPPHRDRLQREIAVEYEVAGSPVTAVSWLFAGVTALGALVMVRRQSGT